MIDDIVSKPVDASQAGEGTLELVVTTRKSSVRAEVLMKSRGLYNVTFIPQEMVSHYINITFNEEDVPGQWCAPVGQVPSLTWLTLNNHCCLNREPLQDRCLQRHQ